MKTLGYIVTDRKIKGIDGFITQIKALEEAIYPLPILIVGWDVAKAHKAYKSVIERQLDERTYWTFKKTESRMDFEKDLSRFYLLVVNSFIEKISYNYLSPKSINRGRIKKILQHVNSSDCGCIYISNGMLYVPINEHVIGLSLRVCEFCGMKSSKIVSKAYESGKVITDKDIDDKSILKWFENKRYAIVYMACEV